jgi:hypothetical protein
MIILAIVMRVILLWVAISFALGLCWALACFIAPRVRRWRAGRARQTTVRPVGRATRRSGATLELQPEDGLVDDLGNPVAPLPRRFAPHTRPAREAVGRVPMARNESERAS